MTQYCRYCDHVDVSRFVFKCRKTGKIMHRPEMKHTNKCKEFKLNIVDALRENPRGYRPTGRKVTQFGGLGKQISMDELFQSGE